MLPASRQDRMKKGKENGKGNGKGKGSPAPASTPRPGDLAGDRQTGVTANG